MIWWSCALIDCLLVRRFIKKCLEIVKNKAEPRRAAVRHPEGPQQSSKKGDLVGIRAALDVVVATPPGAGRSCLGRWFSSSHRLLDAASAAALYRDANT